MEQPPPSAMSPQVKPPSPLPSSHWPSNVQVEPAGQ
jgi:hypothetical protein